MNECVRRSCVYNNNNICFRSEGYCFSIFEVEKQGVQLKPKYNEQYFYVDLASENLFDIAMWLNDPTDWHMLKLGLICNSPKECVLKAKEMLKKLGLIDLV